MESTYGNYEYLKTIVKVQEELIKRLKGTCPQVCATCNYRNNELRTDISAQYCEKEYWGSDSGINIGKMKCDEWSKRQVIIE